MPRPRCGPCAGQEARATLESRDVGRVKSDEERERHGERERVRERETVRERERERERGERERERERERGALPLGGCARSRNSCAQMVPLSASSERGKMSWLVPAPALKGMSRLERRKR